MSFPMPCTILIVNVVNWLSKSNAIYYISLIVLFPTPFTTINVNPHLFTSLINAHVTHAYSTSK